MKFQSLLGIVGHDSKQQQQQQQHTPGVNNSNDCGATRGRTQLVGKKGVGSGGSGKKSPLQKMVRTHILPPLVIKNSAV